MKNHTNQAIWLNAKGEALTFAEAAITAPGPGEVLVRTRAIALNPFDGIVQTLGSLVTPWVAYPAILGSDVAGEVLAVGVGVTRIKVGDRVLGLALGVDKTRNRPAEGAFQHYVILGENSVTLIPESITFEQASVLPLAVATAACGLFLKDQLALEKPSANERPSGKGTLVVWGGSTSVGGCAIQLAVAAGYTVVATASPKNFNHVKRLGASQVFDYNDPHAVRDMVQALQGHQVVGALAIAVGSGAMCIDLVSRCQGNRMVSMASAPLSLGDAPIKHQFLWKLKTLPRLAKGFASLAILARMKGVYVRSIWGTALVKESLGREIFADFLGPALANGRFVPAPEPLLAGHSLKDIPAAMTLLGRGVSARKVVILL